MWRLSASCWKTISTLITLILSAGRLLEAIVLNDEAPKQQAIVKLGCWTTVRIHMTDKYGKNPA